MKICSGLDKHVLFLTARNALLTLRCYFSRPILHPYHLHSLCIRPEQAAVWWVPAGISIWCIESSMDHLFLSQLILSQLVLSQLTCNLTRAQLFIFLSLFRVCLFVSCLFICSFGVASVWPKFLLRKRVATLMIWNLKQIAMYFFACALQWCRCFGCSPSSMSSGSLWMASVNHLSAFAQSEYYWSDTYYCLRYDRSWIYLC